MLIALSPARSKDFSNYTSWLESYNIDYIVLTKAQPIPLNCTMLVLTGGEDIGTSPRDVSETKWLMQALKREIPVLGICRGLQLINVFFGGTLVQDINENLGISGHESFKEFEESKTKLSEYHDAQVIQGNFSSYMFHNNHKFSVNSRHHQCIENLGEELIVEAEHGFVPEAISCEKRKLIGVQWHPERQEVRGSYCEQTVIRWIFKVHNQDFAQVKFLNENFEAEQEIKLELNESEFINIQNLIILISTPVELRLKVNSVYRVKKKVKVSIERYFVETKLTETATLDFDKISTKVQHNIIQYLQENKLIK